MCLCPWKNNTQSYNFVFDIIGITNLKMYNLTKLKILVIGPEACGKTTLVNYLAEKQNVLENPYRPTTGVRIVEHETYVDNRLVQIEFWDVSGRH